MAGKKRKSASAVKKELVKYFAFEEKDDQLSTGKLKCQLPGCSKVLVYDYNQGWKNHERHLINIHKIDPAEIDPPASRSLEGFGFVQVDGGTSNKNTWKRSDPRQVQFEESLLDLICISGVPWNLTNQLPFIRLVRGLQKSVRIPSRQALGQKLVKHHKKVRKSLQEKLKLVEPEQLHLSLDHWTSRRHTSVLGIRCHFIDKYWQMQNYTIGFLEFPWRKTSSNVLEVFKKFIAEECGITPDQIGIVMTDNASEMRAAFSDIAQDNSTLDATYENDEEESEWLDVQDCDLNEEDEEFCEELTEVDRVQAKQLYDSVIDDCIDWSQTTLERKGCVTHALHLTVMECLKNNPAASSLIKYLHKLVAFFTMSTYWHSKLMEKTKKELIKPGATRWNRVLNALNRLLENGFIDSINLVLTEAKREAGGKYNGPLSIDNVLKEQILELSKLLSPFLILTNTLQGDGVTSSLAIPGIIGLYKGIASTSCTTEYMRALRGSLCLAITERFALESTFVQTGAGKNKALLKIFDSESYIMATILDPRLKTVPFQVPLEENYMLNMYVPSVERVTSILTAHYDKERTKCGTSEVVPEASPQPSLRTNPSTSLIFSHIHQASQAHSPPPQEVMDEVKEYLKEPIISDTRSPLEYWKRCSKSFPILSRLARKHLAIPASSGSVERLFSIAGALIRARRARLTIDNVSRMIQYREYRLSRLNSKK